MEQGMQLPNLDHEVIYAQSPEPPKAKYPNKNQELFDKLKG